MAGEIRVALLPPIAYYYNLKATTLAALAWYTASLCFRDCSITLERGACKGPSAHSQKKPQSAKSSKPDKCIELDAISVECEGPDSGRLDEIVASIFSVGRKQEKKSITKYFCDNLCLYYDYEKERLVISGPKKSLVKRYGRIDYWGMQNELFIKPIRYIYARGFAVGVVADEEVSGDTVKPKSGFVDVILGGLEPLLYTLTRGIGFGVTLGAERSRVSVEVLAADLGDASLGLREFLEYFYGIDKGAILQACQGTRPERVRFRLRLGAIVGRGIPADFEGALDLARIVRTMLALNVVRGVLAGSLESVQGWPTIALVFRPQQLDKLVNVDLIPASGLAGAVDALAANAERLGVSPSSLAGGLLGLLECLYSGEGLRGEERERGRLAGLAGLALEAAEAALTGNLDEEMLFALVRPLSGVEGLPPGCSRFLSAVGR